MPIINSKTQKLHNALKQDQKIVMFIYAYELICMLIVPLFT